MIPINWRWAAEGADHYPGWHAFVAYSQFLQLKNRWDDPTHVAEVTPPAEGTGSWFQNVPNRERVKFYRPYASVVPLPLDDDGPHGTEAAFLCEPEPDGTYSARIWELDEISEEDWDALPECIRNRWATEYPPAVLIPELPLIIDLAIEVADECDLLLWDDDSPILWDDDSPIEVECPEDLCEYLLWDDDAPILWDDDSPIEIECDDCDSLLWDDESPILWDDDSPIEVECPM